MLKIWPFLTSQSGMNSCTSSPQIKIGIIHFQISTYLQSFIKLSALLWFMVFTNVSRDLIIIFGNLNYIWKVKHKIQSFTWEDFLGFAVSLACHQYFPPWTCYSHHCLVHAYLWSKAHRPIPVSNIYID